MKRLLAIILVCGLTCASVRAGESEPEAAPAAVAEQPDAAVSSGTLSAAEEAAVEEAAPAEEAAESEAPAGFVDTILAVLKSVEAIIAGIVALLTALGVAASAIAKLKKANKALGTVTEKIEEYKQKGDHKTAAQSLSKAIGAALPKETSAGAMLHKHAKIAEAKVKNGG